MSIFNQPDGTKVDPRYPLGTPKNRAVDKKPEEKKPQPLDGKPHILRGVDGHLSTNITGNEEANAPAQPCMQRAKPA